MSFDLFSHAKLENRPHYIKFPKLNHQQGCYNLSRQVLGASNLWEYLFEWSFLLKRRGFMTKNRFRYCFIIFVFSVLVINMKVVYGDEVDLGENISPMKKWTIRFNKEVGKRSSSDIYVQDSNGVKIKNTFVVNGDKLIINPPTGGYDYNKTYSIIVKKSLKAKDNENLTKNYTYKFKIEELKEVVNMDKQGLALNEAVDKQHNRGRAVYQKNGKWITAPRDLIEYYMNPKNFESGQGKYQFLTLNYIEGAKANSINDYLSGKGMLDGMGQAILTGAKKYDINPAYLISHMILETGHGKSPLAQGIKVNGKMVYNMYGIQATDYSPIKGGSQYAYKQGWFTPELAIIEGAKWVGERYINSPKYNQNTLYKMRWNNSVIWHQYSTDVRWAWNQTKRIEEIIEKIGDVKMEFDIPQYTK